jgi:hypothetical protein
MRAWNEIYFVSLNEKQQIPVADVNLVREFVDHCDVVRCMRQVGS